jgi:hypothetical protein
MRHSLKISLHKMEWNNDRLRREENFPFPVYEDQDTINNTDFAAPPENGNRRRTPPQEYHRSKDVPIHKFPPKSKKPAKRKDKFRNR